MSSPELEIGSPAASSSPEPVDRAGQHDAVAPQRRPLLDRVEQVATLSGDVQVGAGHPGEA